MLRTGQVSEERIAHGSAPGRVEELASDEAFEAVIDDRHVDVESRLHEKSCQHANTTLGSQERWGLE